MIELLGLLGILVVTGLFAGVLAGLLGVGGGIIIVPVLNEAFRVAGVDPSIAMHLAVGTSLATIIATSARSLSAHLKYENVDRVLLAKWAPGMVLGVIFGAAVAGFLNGEVLQLVFGLVCILAALNMAFGRESWRLGDIPPLGWPGRGISFVTGGVSSVMGIGGGTLGVPILTLYGFQPKRAVATASGFGLIISIPGTIGFILAGLSADDLPAGSFGYVNLLGVLAIIPMTIVTAPFGARLANRLPRQALSAAFAFFLALVAVRMLGLF